MQASSRLVEVRRGSVVESVHRGHLAAVDADGRCFAWAGDPKALTLWRSAAKPLQSLPLVETGALDGLRLGPAELAVACGSHTGTEAHVSAVDRLLAAALAGQLRQGECSRRGAGAGELRAVFTLRSPA